VKTLKGILLAAVALLLLSAQALAATPSPGLTVKGLATPTSFTTDDNAQCEIDYQQGLEHSSCDQYRITVTNSGSKTTNGTPIVLTDTLPAGLSVIETLARQQRFGQSQVTLTSNCKTQAGPVVSCKFPVHLGPDESLVLQIGVTVNGGAQSGEANTAVVTGGGSPEANITQEDSLDSPPPFGFATFHPLFAGTDGAPDSAAGAHPYELDSRFDLNNLVRFTSADTYEPTGVHDLRDAIVDLPPGVVGSATAAPYCTLVQLGSRAGCPTQTRVGSIITNPSSPAAINSGLFNITPEAGVAAEFGFHDALNKVHVLYASVAPTPEGYVVRTTAVQTPQIPLIEVIPVFYGNPAAKNAVSKTEKEAAENATPMFTNSANCDGEPLKTRIYMDSWQEPGTYNPDGTPNFSDPAWASATSESPPVSGCNQLQFEPSIEAKPETNRADSPTGLEVNLKVPQSEGFETLGTPPLRKAVVTLPQGMTVNPSSANGLQGCSLAQIGVSASGSPNAASPNCPDASKIGTVELETPSLPGVLQGQIYVAKQAENPFNTLLALYITVDDPSTGVIVKIPADIKADPATGQLSTVVDNSPQFPFSELRTHFFGGQRAALRTPAVCGTYKLTSQLTPWSAPESGPPATPSSSFKITQSANGGPCPTTAATQPNAPAFQAGTLSPFAGAYSPFVLHLAREDGSQEFKSLSLALPQGLIGKLAGLSECSDAALASAAARSGAQEQASPSCPASSEVGAVTVGAGAGLTPYYAQGKAYLAGPYKGAPLSLAVITPATAGPYDLGTVVVRNALQVNPETAQISAVSDEIPHILQGIPLDVRSIALNLTRNQFTLNPTNCEKKAITGTATSVLGQGAPLSNPFQVGECKKLGFAPKLRLSLKGKVSRAATPRLIAKLTYPKGNYANIARAQVKLPPSAFLDNAHIQTICTRVQFSSGARLGEGCPARSIYGKAKAITPLLDAPLEGPVYLRSSSHELPDLVVALNGQIPVALSGRTDSVKGALRNTFEFVPDAPVTSFELELFGGKRGLIEMSNGFCKKPNATVNFTAQNGKVYNTTPEVASSCGGKKAKKGKAKKKHHGKR